MSARVPAPNAPAPRRRRDGGGRIGVRIFAGVALAAALGAVAFFILSLRGDKTPLVAQPPATSATPAPSKPKSPGKSKPGPAAKASPTATATTTPAAKKQPKVSSDPAISAPITISSTGLGEPLLPRAADRQVAADADNALPSATPIARPTSANTVGAAMFTVDVPDRWVNDKLDDDRGPFLDSRWHLKADPRIKLIIDATPNASGSAHHQALDVYNAVRKQAGYQELEWRSGLRARQSWRWRFSLGGIEHYDTFATACGVGYALLTAAPVGTYRSHSDSFDAIRRSFAPVCP